MIVEDPEDQQIALDQYDRPHVVNREKTITGYQIVHYRKISNEWIGYVIDSTPNFCNPSKLLFHNNQLYLLYFRDSVPGYPDVHIVFTKYDVITTTNDKALYISKLLIYPNPCSGKTNICFELSEPEFVNLLIYDFSGRQIKKVVKRKMGKGKHLLNWNGENDQGIKVKSGLYLCRLYCGRNVITKSIEIIN